MVNGQFLFGLILFHFNLRWYANNSTIFFLPFQMFGAALIYIFFFINLVVSYVLYLSILHFNIKYSNISNNAKVFPVNKCAQIYCKCKITHCKVGVFGMSQCIFTLWVPASGGQCHLLCPSSTLLHTELSRVSRKSLRQKAMTHIPSGNFTA